MGYAKAQLEKSFSHIGGKFVCANCFEDYAIKNFIELNAKTTECDYCGGVSDSDEPIAADLADVTELIASGVESAYEDPANSAGWCSAEGGWLVTTYDSYELIEELVEVSSDADGLLDDIAGSIEGREWCEIDPYGDPVSDSLYFDWKRFTQQIKHHARYVFYKLPKEKKGIQSYRRPDNPYDILDCIGKYANVLDLITMLPVGTPFIRVRIHKSTEQCTTYKELGPPLAEHAKNANRMSPAGIPMFYASFDEETSLCETSNDSCELLTVATFKTLKPFQVLDLSKLPEVPSIFDEENRWLRQSLIFMNDFLEDISKPVARDGCEHIEYVPTQVVTEYFRHLFRTINRKKIEGIIYPSSVSPEGKSCVLFFEQGQCTQDDIDLDENKWLSMITASVKTVKNDVISAL